MQKETYHIISNTHWDREWYQCHEKFLVRLTELMDRLLDILEAKPEYRFVTDGQLAMVEDYLEVKPENREKTAKLIKNGQLLVGPWYTQPLENIVGGEALIRNLQRGIGETEKMGPAMRFSYEIDEFGHTSQLPQILDGFDIHGVMAWRGVPANCKSYFRWKGPDGTVANFFNSNAGYGEATSLPGSEENFTEIIDGVEFEREGLKNHIERIRELRIHVSDSNHMLWLNGIDHSWAQEDILEVIEKANRLFPEYKIIQSTPAEYAAAVIADLKERNITPPEVCGELMYTYEPVLESTNSLHPRQKRRHYETEKMLVGKVEPLTAVSSLLGAKYPSWGVDRAWKYVLENHAHDSLGCCSVDEVYEQVMARYGASISLSEQLVDDALRCIMSFSEKKPSLWIFNFAEKSVSGSVFAEFDVPVGFASDDITLETAGGESVAFCVISKEKLGDVRYNPRLGHPVWGHVLHYRAIIDTPQISPYGALRLNIRSVKLPKSEKNRYDCFFVKEPGVMENDYLKVRFNSNGTFNLTDKVNCRDYPNQMLFTDDGESGHCYIHKEPENDTRQFTSFGCSAQIIKVYDTPLGACCNVKLCMELPKGITSDRKYRTEQTDNVDIEYSVYLERDSDCLRIEAGINNRCRNHRIRVLFPTYLENALVSESGQAFDEVERDITVPVSDDCTELPYTTHPMQDYCAVHCGKYGLGVAARGIYEYECIDDQSRTLALTLLKAVDVIDNDTFEETPKYFMHEAQNLCKISYSLTLIPYNGSRGNLLPRVKGAVMPPVAAANRDTEVSLMPGYVHPANILGDSFSVVSLEGEGLEITCLKKAMSGNGTVIRVRNRTSETVNGKLKLSLPGVNVSSVYKASLNETGAEKIAEGNSVEFSVGGKKLMTFIFLSTDSEAQTDSF